MKAIISLVAGAPVRLTRVTGGWMDVFRLPPAASINRAIGSVGLSCLMLATMPGTLSAAIEADFITNRGTITAVLEHQKAPKAVANLIGLATARRSHIDPVTGKVLRSPFFDGAVFFNVVNNASTKLIETGSPTNAAGAGPGYAFSDEFDHSLVHDPYVLSMSNNGPNTNGSCLVFTGNLAMPDRNGVNTVFGRAASASSRAVIDSILSAAPGTSFIHSVVVRKTGADAGFDIEAVGLPMAGPVDSPLLVHPGVSVLWAGNQPAASVLQAHESRDLRFWMPHFRHMVGLGETSPTQPLFVDSAPFASRFYQFSIVQYPGILGKSSMARRTLTLESPGIGTIIYRFNAAGSGGTYENIVFPGDPPFFSGSFEVSGLAAPRLDPYSFQLLIHSPGLGGSPYQLIRGGYDASSAGKVTGRHRTSFSSESLSPVMEEAGSLSLTGP